MRSVASRLGRLLAVFGALVAAEIAVGQERPETPSEGVVSGRVLGPLGEPIPACRVELRESRSVGIADAQTLTDGEGLFVLRAPIRDRASLVRAVTPGLATASTAVVLSAAEPMAYVELRLWDAGRVRGRVVDRGGQPVPGAEIAAGRDVAAVRSDAEGGFVIEDVALGPVEIAAWRDGFACAVESLWLDDETTVELVLAPAADGMQLEVGVVGLPEGVVARFRLRAVEGVGHPQLPASLVEGAAETGRSWRRSGLPAYRYEIRPAADGYVMEPAMAARGPAGASHVAVFRARKLDAATPAPGVRVGGQIVGLDGAGLADVEFECRDPASGPGRHPHRSPRRVRVRRSLARRRCLCSDGGARARAGRQLLTVRLGGQQPVFSGENFVVKSGERVERPIRIE